MTFAELRAEVYRRIREVTSDGSQVMWADADVEQSLNEGLHEIADECEFHEKVQTVAVLKDHRYYDMRHIPRDDFLVAGPAFNNVTQRWLIPTSAADLETQDLRWEERIAEPERMLVRGLWWVGYWPVKGVASGSILQHYIGLPDYMSADTDTPPFHTSFHYGLVEYALWDLFSQDGEVDLAWAAWKEYQEYEKGLRDHTDGRASMARHRGLRSTDYGS